MKRSRMMWVLAAMLIYALSGIGGALAVHEDTAPLIAHIDVDTPGHYGSCVDEVTSDTIHITNVHNPNDSSIPWTLRGQVIVQYVTDTGRIVVPDGFYAVDHVGDLDLTVYYPPGSEWPIQSGGGTEIHVDIQIEVFDEFGNMVGHIGFGPGHDWDVWCDNPPPPPPPPDDPGTAGCTPGYWRNHLTAWVPTGYSPDQLFGTVFGVNASGNPTLGEAVVANGGGENALLRHATAALLNAASSGVDYEFTVAEVIQIVQNAYATGDFETAKNLLEAENEKGCTLEGFENTTAGNNNGKNNANKAGKKP